MPEPPGFPRSTKRVQRDGPGTDWPQLLRNKAEEEAATKKKTEEGAAAKQKAEEEAAAMIKAEWEAATQKMAEEEAAAKKKKEEEVTEVFPTAHSLLRGFFSPALA